MAAGAVQCGERPGTQRVRGVGHPGEVAPDGVAESGGEHGDVLGGVDVACRDRGPGRVRSRSSSRSRRSEPEIVERTASSTRRRRRRQLAEPAEQIVASGEPHRLERGRSRGRQGVVARPHRPEVGVEPGDLPVEQGPVRLVADRGPGCRRGCRPTQDARRRPSLRRRRQRGPPAGAVRGRPVRRRDHTDRGERRTTRPDPLDSARRP